MSGGGSSDAVVKTF